MLPTEYAVNHASKVDVEVPHLDRFEVGMASFRPRRGGFRQADARLGAPLRRRVARPRRGQGDDRQEYRLDNRDDAIPVRVGIALAGMLGVLSNLLANLLVTDPLAWRSFSFGFDSCTTSRGSLPYGGEPAWPT